MRVCPVCGRLYADEAEFCQADGHRLGATSQLPKPSDTDDARIGQLLFERYLVYRVVADGGMGRVYEALDQHARRQVALKVLHAEIAADPISVERFKREYEVSLQLPHEHIVEVTDFRPLQDGSHVLVMEFLQGEELRSTLRRVRTLPPARLVRLLSQLALGLDPAHQRAFVHRDLKPDNVFLCQTPSGDVVKVLDFGSVKDRAASKQLTVTGTTIGSPYYMSPEQALGLATLDHRADVWAVAVISYQCLSGSFPFSGSNAPAILLEILSRTPTPLSEVAAKAGLALPKALDSVIAAGLDKEPEHRTASVGAFADAVGTAFGLDADHHLWSHTSEAELARRIEAAPKLAHGSADVAVDFFHATPELADGAAQGASGAKRRWLLALGCVSLIVLASYWFWVWA